MVEFYGEAVFVSITGNWKLTATIYTQGTGSISGIIDFLRLGNLGGGQHVMVSMPLNRLGDEIYQATWGSQPTPLGITDITFKGTA